MPSKKVIITGITGQDGSYMAEYLLQNTNYEILGGIRRTSQRIDSNLENCINNSRFRLVQVDLCDVHSITSLIEKEKPDYWLNLGGQTYVADSWDSPALHLQTNAMALVHILEAIRKYVPNCRVYSAGSSEQWGNVKYSPQDINHPFSPRSIYGVSKCTAALVCKVYRESYGLYVVHGILTNHESQRRQEYFVTRKITKGVARIKRAIELGNSFEPIELGNLNAQRDWSHAKDFVAGIWMMLNQEEYIQKQAIAANCDVNLVFENFIPKEYVLASGETHTVREFVDLAFAEAGIATCWYTPVGMFDGYEELRQNLYDPKIDSPCGTTRLGPVLVKVNPKFYRPADVELLMGDSTPIRQELGWTPKTSFKELVSKMVRHDIALTNK